jgi:hypothetical protein
MTRWLMDGRGPARKGVNPVPAPLTPEEFEATRNACALTIARHERILAWRDQRLEMVMVTRAVIDHSRDLMAWADALLKGRV